MRDAAAVTETALKLRIATRRLHQACPEIASAPQCARRPDGRFENPRAAALHNRLRKEVA